MAHFSIAVHYRTQTQRDVEIKLKPRIILNQHSWSIFKDIQFLRTFLEPLIKLINKQLIIFSIQIFNSASPTWARLSHQ